MTKEQLENNIATLLEQFTLENRESVQNISIAALQEAEYFVEVELFSDNSISYQDGIFGLKLLASFDVTPCAKPRMTQSDKWKQRSVTTKYWQFKNKLKKQAKLKKFDMPQCNYRLVFYIPMPQSWSKKKKTKMNMKPHQAKQRNDKDNLEKAFLDALLDEDSSIWDGRVTKVWSYKGKIEVWQIGW